MAERIEGMKALLSALDNLSDDAQKLLPKIVEANARELEEEAKRLAPVDTGKLQQSIKQAVPISDKGEGLSRVVQSNATGLAPYDIHVEYGTRFARSQPFLFPAFFKQQRIFLNDIKKLLKNSLK